MATTVEVIADAIKAVGTAFITGHPGGESVELMEAARQRDMRFLLFKQEVAAAMMAATWGEITGQPGLCLSTRGPGASNMVNGVAYAALDRAPLIAITDQYDPATYATGLRQRLNQLAMYDPLVKWSTTINAKTVRQQMRRALRETTSLPPGPVHFEMPQSETTRDATDYPGDAPLLANIVAIEPDRASLRAALELVGSARRPVILVGLGALWGKASASVTALAEHLDAPVLTTAKCKGVVSEDHSLRAGCIIGGIIERKLVSQADLIITIGLDAVELQPKAWPYSAPVLSISATPTTDAMVPIGTEVVGPVGPILDRLAEFSSGGTGWGEKAAAAYRDDVINALNTPSSGLSPQRVMEVARAVLPRDTIATCDAGASRLLVVQKWEAYGPREFLGSNGLGSMGYALPGAMAAKMAHPDRPCVAFVGDGGFLMSVAELQTSVAERLPVICIVFDDAQIGLIRVKQQLKQIPRFGVEMGGLHWDKMAEGFGADGVVVDNEQALEVALKAALASEKTTVIGAKIDGSGYVDQFNALREL